MNFRTYDILSSLIPGFAVLLSTVYLFNFIYDKDFIVGYTAMAFLIGYFVNTISSWLEGLYFLSWGGSPAGKLLDGKNIWKVRFYRSSEVKNLLLSESTSSKPSNNELFSIASGSVNGQKDTRIEDFIANYAFSRAILTTVLIITIMVLIKDYSNLRLIALVLGLLIMAWLRCKQRSYYYCREVLDTYLNNKKSKA